MTLTTLSLDELRSPDFNLLFDQEYSEEEEVEAMAETMEQYMSKTQTDYGSRELRENTFSGLDNEDANEHIEKVLEIVDLFHVPKITVDHLMLRVFHISLTGAVSRWLRNKPTGSIKTWEDLKIKFLNKYCPPGRTAKKMEEINNFQQEPDETLFQAWEHFKELLMKYPQHCLTEMQEVILFYNGLDILTRQILDSRGVIPTMTAADAKKAIQEMAEYSQKWHNGTSRGRSTETSDGLAAIQAQLKKSKKADQKDPFLEDYIELNDLNEPIKLRRNQEDDLMPTIEEGKVIEEFRTKDEDLDTGIDDYPSYCDDDKKIHINCAHNLRFSCMIGFEFTHANFFPLLYVNVMSKRFHNSIMKDNMVYKGNNVVGAVMNVPIFVGYFSIVTDFVVLENIDAYHDERMGNIIVGEPFLREVGIKAKWFKGIITLYKNNDEATYQMVRSHPRFKNHTNKQCNKIPPLLKVSEKDEKNEISHAYQKLKGFYKGVLNLGPEYIRNAKTEEWLTRRHISMHKME
ncbi:homeodomain-like protein [Tanacetum coccineum]